MVQFFENDRTIGRTGAVDAPWENVESTSFSALKDLESARKSLSAKTSPDHKAALGQFMTPAPIAAFMASIFRPLHGRQMRVLDAGAGIGSLTASVVFRAAKERAKSVSCEVWEVDAKLHHQLVSTMALCEAVMAASHIPFVYNVRGDDYIVNSNDLFSREGVTERPTHAILNPPYKKISSDSLHRLALRRAGVETSNLYAGFVALALMSLAPGGELVAITPRSFCNGPYFRPFRELILQTSCVSRVHVFQSRTEAFEHDEVLQENIIFYLVKGASQADVIISSSHDSTFRDYEERKVAFDKVILPGDTERIFHLVANEVSRQTLELERVYRFTLDELGFGVSTGPVVDFRLREHLRGEHARDRVALVNTQHFVSGEVQHPSAESRKPNWIENNAVTCKWLMPRGNYVLIRRLSSKEERRRIVTAVFQAEKAESDLIGFDNKLNVIHRNKKGLDLAEAKGLALYLSSSFADQWLRRFSGHTQVNASDLKVLRYPDLSTLKVWGESVADSWPTQAEIDRLVGYEGAGHD